MDGCASNTRIAAGNWIGVTRTWLAVGIRTRPAIPTAPGGNTVHPNAILIFQELAGDRNVNGGASPPRMLRQNGTGANSQYSWYPINFYDPREGFPRDTNAWLGGNAVLRQRHHERGRTGRRQLEPMAAGKYRRRRTLLVNYSGQNGYLVYFSDRRGMLA